MCVHTCSTISSVVKYARILKASVAMVSCALGTRALTSVAAMDVHVAAMTMGCLKVHHWGTLHAANPNCPQTKNSGIDYLMAVGCKGITRSARWTPEEQQDGNFDLWGTLPILFFVITERLVAFHDVV